MGVKSIFNIIVQTLLLSLCALVGSWIAGLLHIDIPGSIIGIFLLFFLLKSRAIKLNWVESGANWLLSQLLLFFIPSAVGVSQYQSVMRTEGLQIVLVIVLSTLAVMIATGVFAEFLVKKRGVNHESDARNH